jgi:hypothetical protein
MNSNPNHKFGAIAVFVDPKNYLSNKLERDTTHTLRFPSKYEYKIYCSIKQYLSSKPRYSLELQYRIELLKKGVLTTSVCHFVDFVIIDSESKFNPILFIEAKGKFLPEYNLKMNLMKALKPDIYQRYLVVSDNHPPKSYTNFYSRTDRLQAALYALGVR